MIREKRGVRSDGLNMGMHCLFFLFIPAVSFEGCCLMLVTMALRLP